LVLKKRAERPEAAIGALREVVTEVRSR